MTFSGFARITLSISRARSLCERQLSAFLTKALNEWRTVGRIVGSHQYASPFSVDLNNLRSSTCFPPVVAKRRAFRQARRRGLGCSKGRLRHSATRCIRLASTRCPAHTHGPRPREARTPASPAAEVHRNRSCSSGRKVSAGAGRCDQGRGNSDPFDTRSNRGLVRASKRVVLPRQPITQLQPGLLPRVKPGRRSGLGRLRSDTERHSPIS